MPSTAKLLSGLRFCLAGPGRAGASLASWMVAAGARLTSVAGRDPAGAASELANRLGGRPGSLESLGGEGEDLLLVAITDTALDEVARALADRHRATVALHTAGSRGAEALAPLAACGTRIGACHPLAAFPRPLLDPAAAAGVVFALDGNPEARALARRLVAAWDGVAVEVPPEARLLYHFAATLAAGGVVTLLATAVSISRSLGLPAAIESGYLALARGALARVPATAAGGCEPAAAITGPAARGDAATVLAALTALEAVAPDASRPARAILGETLRQLALHQPLSPAQQDLSDRLCASAAEAE